MSNADSNEIDRILQQVAQQAANFDGRARGEAGAVPDLGGYDDGDAGAYDDGAPYDMGDPNDDDFGASGDYLEGYEDGAADAYGYDEDGAVPDLGAPARRRVGRAPTALAHRAAPRAVARRMAAPAANRRPSLIPARVTPATLPGPRATSAGDELAVPFFLITGVTGDRADAFGGSIGRTAQGLLAPLNGPVGHNTFSGRTLKQAMIEYLRRAPEQDVVFSTTSAGTGIPIPLPMLPPASSRSRIAPFMEFYLSGPPLITTPVFDLQAFWVGNVIEDDVAVGTAVPFRLRYRLTADGVLSFMVFPYIITNTTTSFQALSAARSTALFSGAAPLVRTPTIILLGVPGGVDVTTTLPGRTNAMNNFAAGLSNSLKLARQMRGLRGLVS